ncbi:MAG: S8 family serine peptidase, partial [Bacteroidota bacterium]
DGSEAQTWLEVGATSWRSDLVAPFSNYGKKSVDFFAPGVAIYSTTPGNTYNLHNGTSMACPAAVGVAAMLLSYFPELTAVQVKDILRQSARKLSDIVVNKPGTAIKLLFADLSSTGGLLNAYEAVKTAMTVKMGAGAK